LLTHVYKMRYFLRTTKDYQYQVSKIKNQHKYDLPKLETTRDVCITMEFQYNKYKLITIKLIDTCITFGLGYIQYSLELSNVYPMNSLELQDPYQ